MHGHKGYLSQEFVELGKQLFFLGHVSGQFQPVFLLAETQLLPDVQQIIHLVGCLLAGKCIDKEQLAFVESKDFHRVFPEVDVQLAHLVFAVFLGEMFDQRTDTGKDACLREVLGQQLMGIFVHPEEQGNVAFAQYVAEHGLVLVFRKVLIEEGFCLLVFEQFEGNSRKTGTVYQDISLLVWVFYLFGGGYHFFQIGRERIGRIDGESAEEEIVLVGGGMDRKRKSIRTQADG